MLRDWSSSDRSCLKLRELLRNRCRSRNQLIISLKLIDVFAESVTAFVHLFTNVDAVAALEFVILPENPA